MIPKTISASRSRLSAAPPRDGKNHCECGAGRSGVAAIERAVAHMRDNFAERINLSDLATIAELSVFRFVTVFRRHMGLPPHRYLNHIRVHHAQMLLGEGIPPAIAAIEAGFFDQSHLSRHFKSICGMTPGQYLSQVRGAAPEPYERTERLRPVAEAGAAT